MREEGKEFYLRVHLLSPIFSFATFYSMKVNGPRLQGSIPWPHGMPASMPHHGKRSQKFSVCRAAAKGLAPLVLQEITGHPQAGRNVEHRISG